MVSSNQDHNIADVITEIYNKVGLNGAISIYEGSGFSRDTKVEYVQGLSFDSGFLSPYFAQDRTKIVFDDGSIYMALVDGTVETERDLIKLLEFCKKTMRPMIIVA